MIARSRLQRSSRVWGPLLVAALPSCLYCAGADPDVPERAEECGDWEYLELAGLGADGQPHPEAVPVYAAGLGASKVLLSLDDASLAGECIWVRVLHGGWVVAQQALTFADVPLVELTLPVSQSTALKGQGLALEVHAGNRHLFFEAAAQQRVAAISSSTDSTVDPLPASGNAEPCTGIVQGAGIELGDAASGSFTPWSEGSPAEYRRSFQGLEMVTPWVQISGPVPSGTCGYVTIRDIASDYYADVGFISFEGASGQAVAGPLWVPVDVSGSLDFDAVANLEVEVIAGNVRHVRMLSVPVVDAL